MQAEEPTNEPEELSPFLTTGPVVDALNRLERGLGVRRPFVLVTGPTGTGKTTLVAEALRRWSERVTPGTLEPGSTEVAALATALLTAFGGTLKPGTHAIAVPERMLETLANATAGGRIAVLLVDDADSLADEALLELQRLAGRAEQRQCPLEVILVGSPALAKRLDTAPLEGLRADVSVRVSLDPLTPHDTRHYLLQRPVGHQGATMFSRKACRDIHAAARGRIRDIEAIAAEAARRAMRANATTVSPEHVRAAAQAVRSRRPADPVNASPGQAPPRAAQAAPEPAAARELIAKLEPAPTAADETAEATPAVETVAQGSHVDEEVSASVVAGTISDSGQFKPSDDPRVKDWLSRFGGAGVRIGASYAPRSSSELDFSEESVGDVRPIGTAPSAAPATPALGAAPPATPQAPWHADAGAAEPPAWPPLRAVPRKGPVLGRRRDSTFVWQASTLVLGLALGVVLLSQRNMAPREPRAVTAEVIPNPDSVRAQATPRSKDAASKRGNKRNSTRTARSEPVQPMTVRYVVAVGTFLNAELARSERDHLARLIPYRVWVNATTVGGVKSFRIQFGTFASRDEAVEAAQKLLRRGLLRDASVEELPSAD